MLYVLQAKEKGNYQASNLKMLSQKLLNYNLSIKKLLSRIHVDLSLVFFLINSEIMFLLFYYYHDFSSRDNVDIACVIQNF